MADDAEPKTRFEPPPWEREAFERFRAEQEQQRADLEAPNEEAKPSNSAGASELPTQTRKEAAATAGESDGAPAKIGDAQIETMLIGLRAEEPPSARANMAIINTVIGLFVGAGVLLIVQAALLFGRTRATGASGMLGATASMLVMLAGLGFVGGAILLFRKYHR